MTPAQWLFHYKEVMEFKKEQNDKFGILLEYLELVGTMANPQAGKILIEAKELREAQQEIDENQFAEYFEELKKHIPTTLKVRMRSAEDSKYILPKYKREKREPGISFNKGGEE